MGENELDDVVLHLNRVAMNYLKRENYTATLKALKEAERTLKSSQAPFNPKLTAVTMNNFGCFYKRVNKPNVALRFLQQACESESIEPVDKVNLAGTLLNMCAIFSQLGKHETALAHAIRALRLIEECEASSLNMVSTLIIGYFNAGVEYEFLGKLKETVECYKTAWDFAVKQLGEFNELTQSMQKSYVETLDKLVKSETRSDARDSIRQKGRVQQQEKREKKGSERLRKLPEIKVREKKPSRQQTAGVKEIVESDHGNLNKVRFLTGDRLQPMHKSSRNSTPGYKPFSSQSNSRTARINFNRTQEFPSDLGPPRKHVSDQKPKETNRLKVDPLSLDIENFSFDKIKELYELEKANEVKEEIFGVGEVIKEVEQQIRENRKTGSRGEDQRAKGKEGAKNHIGMEAVEEELGEEAHIDAKEQSKSVKSLGETEGKAEESKILEEDAGYRRSEAIDAILEEPNIDQNGLIGKDSENLDEEEKVISPAVTIMGEKSKGGSVKALDENTGISGEDHQKVQAKEKEPLVVTQAAFRSHLYQKSILKLHSAAVIIQKHVRRYQCHQLYVEIKSAIVFIQSVFRGYQIRKKLNRINP